METRQIERHSQYNDDHHESDHNGENGDDVNSSNNVSNGSSWSNFLVNLTPNRTRSNLNALNRTLISGGGSGVFASGDDGHEEYSNDGDKYCPTTTSQNNPSKQSTKPTYPNDRNLLFAHSLNAANIENRFPKSWGNFINIFDEQGKQKSCISRAQLSNYLELENFVVPNSTFTFYATLFTGNYPKPLYNGSGTNWRMRFNIFASGLNLEKTIETPLKQASVVPKDITLTPDNVFHLGELHIYFHVERGCHEPLYQNLCFFYDQTLLSVSECITIKQQLEECAQQLKSELSHTKFIKQFYFPIEKSRFKAVDQSVEYFNLRQKDLDAAIQLVNGEVPYCVLHRAPNHVTERPTNAGHLNQKTQCSSA